MDLSRVTFVDYETSLICPGQILPPPAIATTYHPADGARLWKTADLPRMWDALLDDTERGGYIGGHDIARFDLPVTCQWMPWLRPRIWDALERDRIYDTLTAERIIEINRGQRGALALDMVALKHGIPMKAKAESRDIRTSFGQFIGAEVIPPAHAEYALLDAVIPHQIAKRQLASGLVGQADVGELVRQSFALGIVAARGFRTDLENVRTLDRLINERIVMLEEIAREFGFLKTGARGEVSRNMTAIKLAIACDYADVPYAHPSASLNARGKVTKKGIDEAWKAALAAVEAHPAVPRTDKGNVATDRLTLEDSSDPKLQALSEWSQLLSVKNKDIGKFYEGTQSPVHSRFGIADTTRSTASDPNSQNWGKREGVRECIRAREGYALAVSDFKMLELVALAQICVERLGLRSMADKINGGTDMHAEIGADVLGIPYADVVARRKAGDHEAEEARDSGKPANFGLNGGMNDPKTFQLYARKSYGQRLTLEQCQSIMAAWRGRAVDQQAWLRLVRSSKNGMGLYDMKHPRMQNMWRRGLRYTEACNGPFQVLGMRVAALALWKVIRAQYCSGEMAGSHVVMFVHDDITSEVPLDKVAEHCAIQERLMAEASREICPDVYAGVDSRVLSHLSKGAKVSKDAAGNVCVTRVHMPESLERKK